jgi:hypothetical protein
VTQPLTYHNMQRGQIIVDGNRTGFRNVVLLFLVCSWFVCYCVLCVSSQVCLFCTGNLAPLHVVICEWLCHLLPPVFFLASSVYVCVCVCVCPGLCAILCCVCFPRLFVRYWYFGSLCVLLIVSGCVTCCHLCFFWLLVFMCVCVCPGRLLCGL